LYGLVFSLFLPFALIASLRTFHETQFPIFGIFAARTYNYYPLVKGVWWYLPYFSTSNPVASALFIVLLGGAVTGLIMLRVGYDRQMLLWEQRREARKGRLRDDIRGKLD
jgi:hypothetical protein